MDGYKKTACGRSGAIVQVLSGCGSRFPLNWGGSADNAFTGIFVWAPVWPTTFIRPESWTCLAGSVRMLRTWGFSLNHVRGFKGQGWHRIFSPRWGIKIP